MTHKDLINKITFSLEHDALTRVHFTQKVYRLPIVGKFVMLEDHEELLQKRMMRFVTNGKADSYAKAPGTYFTRILNLEEIADVKSFV